MLGFSDMISVVIRMTLIQLETADDMRGRVSAVNSLFVIASNQLGDFRAGLMAAWLGTIPAVMVGGVGALLVVLIGRKVFAALYRVESSRNRAALTAPPLARAGFRGVIFAGIALATAFFLIEAVSAAVGGLSQCSMNSASQARQAGSCISRPSKWVSRGLAFGRVMRSWPRVVHRHMVA